ncbi:MAG: UDP-N-acetylmuramoyl-L-alanine--D-glutamate ligase [Pseudomonadota bacterium]|nr:UDP-N-acetylmuramoyl-L-alanine--D-glutamate ligase [Pseudomonadota bacterium]
MQSIIDTPYLIVGLGETGLSVARYLYARGYRFEVADTRNAPPGLDRLRALAPEIPVLLGPLDAERLATADTLVVSPGVSLADPAIRSARSRGAEVIGDIELFAREARAPIAAITGSNGKSSVTTLLAGMTAATGREVRAGGNLGTPALDLLPGGNPDLYVLELSSFQLESTPGLRPRAAVVLNVTADHMDRYPDLNAYARAKSAIYEGADARIVNRDDPLVAAMASGANCIGFGLGVPKEGDYGLLMTGARQWIARGRERLLGIDELRLRGSHNLANVLAALAMGEALGLELDAMLRAAGSFDGLPHRTQWVAESAGVTWYNDSKGTNVGATLAALNGMPGPGILIAGGIGKGADFAPLASAVRDKTHGVVLIGRDAAALAAALKGAAPIELASDMRDAVRRAARMARRGDSVLLSPACASFDMFEGYAERGEAFMEAVREQIA